MGTVKMFLPSSILCKDQAGTTQRVNTAWHFEPFLTSSLPLLPSKHTRTISRVLTPRCCCAQDLNAGKLHKKKADLRSYLAGQRMDVTRLEADSYLYKLEAERNGWVLLLGLFSHSV